MNTLVTTLRRRLAAEDGFTLTELLMGIVLGLMIVGIGTMIFTAAIRSQPGQSARSEAVRDGRVMTERLVRELRQGERLDASAGDSWSSQSLSIRTFVHSNCVGAYSDQARLCRVTYTCTADSCTRVEADLSTGAQGPAVQQLSGLATPSVFAYETDPTADCPVPSPAGEAITITDGATLRNSGASPGRLCVALVFA